MVHKICKDCSPWLTSLQKENVGLRRRLKISGAGADELLKRKVANLKGTLSSNMRSRRKLIAEVHLLDRSIRGLRDTLNKVPDNFIHQSKYKYVRAAKRQANLIAKDKKRNKLYTLGD